MLTPIAAQGGGGLLHLQFASSARLRAKQALYKMQEVLRWPGRQTPDQIDRMYDGTTLDVPRHTSPIPEAWWAGVARAHIDVGAEPWQSAEVRRLWAEHGPERFAGLDLYGCER